MVVGVKRIGQLNNPPACDNAVFYHPQFPEQRQRTVQTRPVGHRRIIGQELAR